MIKRMRKIAQGNKYPLSYFWQVIDIEGVDVDELNFIKKF
mgnify:CR=1 FL=1